MVNDTTGAEAADPAVHTPPRSEAKAMAGARNPEPRRDLERGSAWKLGDHGGRDVVRGVAAPNSCRVPSPPELYARAEIFGAHPAGPRAGFQRQRRATPTA